MKTNPPRNQYDEPQPPGDPAWLGRHVSYVRMGFLNPRKSKKKSKRKKR